MKILILNGSPKGDYSTTLYTSLYMKKHHPEHTWEICPVASRIAALEKDITPVVEKMLAADLIIFSYPLYTFLAPSQLHRFIELLKASGADFSGKCVTQITTSKHFYDITGHRFIEDNCRDLHMNVIRGLSADMEDLLSEKGQKEALSFFDYVCWKMHPTPTPTDRDFDVVIVTDLAPEDTDLANRIQQFQTAFPFSTRIINLREFPFKGGCLGCLNCASNGKCIYNDGFDEFLRNKIQTADGTIYAFTVRDHSLGSLFKMYDDRQFCNGHRAVTAGSPLGYLVNGSLENETNLQMLLTARAEAGGNFLAGIATDPDSVQEMADTFAYALTRKFTLPQTFYGVGGTKIFRDLIYQMQGFMKADHAFFKSRGLYDFPQKKKGTILAMYLVGALFSNEKMKKKAGPKMKEGMIAGYKKVLEQDEAKTKS